MLKEDAPDMNAINSNLEYISDLTLEIAKNRAQMHVDVKAELNDDQKEWYNKNVLKPSLLPRKQGTNKGKKNLPLILEKNKKLED